MTDLPALRSQIKEWERSFRETHGTNPTVDDIKQQPGLAEKYKLYKKLSKSIASSSSSFARPSSIPARPVTPPKHNSSLMPHHTRTAQVTDPLSSFNPFSPRKNGNQAQSHTLTASPPSRHKKSPSPGSSPDSVSAAADERPELPVHAQSTAIGRARKRLRGDPVSPSPKKQKLPRVDATAPPIPKLHVPPRGLDDSDDEGHLPFIASSPAKSSTRGKRLKILFDDGENTGDSTIPQLPLLKLSATGGLFGNGMKSGSKKGVTSFGNSLAKISHISSNDADFDVGPSSTQVTDPNSLESAGPSSSGKKLQPTLPSQPHTPVAPNGSSNITKGRKKTPSNELHARRDQILRGQSKGQYRDDSDDEHGAVRDNVKLVDRPRFVHAVMDDQSGFDIDPLLHYSHRGKPHGHNPSSRRVDETQEESFRVDLPEKLLHVLDLQSGEPQAPHNLDEEKVAEGLIYGRRFGYYDPSRGGEIWDIGEGDGGRSLTEEEQDWEGEPVPWAVGEL